MKKLVFLSFFCAVFSGWSLHAQTKDEPGWIRNTPKAGNSTYMYVVERATGSTYDEARNNALARVYHSTIMRVGAVVSWDEINAAVQKGEDWGTVGMKYNIPVNKVCEYGQKKEYGFLVAVLCQVAKTGNSYPTFEEFSGCYDIKEYSNYISLIKSAFIPGLGQMGKNRTAEGVLTLSGEVILIGGAVSTYYVAKHQFSIMDDINCTFQQYNMAKKRYNVCRAINITCITAASVLYAYNLFRAWTVTPKYQNTRHYAFAPTVINNGQGFSTCISLTYNF